MPAILEEAFSSPFYKFKGLNPHGQMNPHGQIDQTQSTSDTESLRNPLWIQQEIKADPVKEHQVKVNQVKAHPVKDEQPAPVQDNHNCDRSLAVIMSCPHCRNKLRMLMSQNGGAINVPNFNIENLNNSTVSNFLFGIAVLFLVDRMIKLTARTA
jgi:hypothetical protein